DRQRRGARKPRLGTGAGAPKTPQAAAAGGKLRSRLLVPRPKQEAAPRPAPPIEPVTPLPRVAATPKPAPAPAQPPPKAQSRPQAQTAARPAPKPRPQPQAQPAAPPPPPAAQKPAAPPPPPALIKELEAAPVARPEPPPPPALTRELEAGRKPATPPAPPAAEALLGAQPTGTQKAALPPSGGLTETRLVFEQGSAELSEAAKAQLQVLAKQLAQNSAARVQLLAYAKDTGNGSSRARRLSLSRALAVRAFLIDQGIRSTRLDVRALGNKVDGGPADRVDILPQGAGR
ncbi:MAG: OmpA family protein, partial [Kiloniellaceae bacterium]